MSVGRICLRDVDLGQRDESACEAARRMQERGVGTLLVLDEARTPVGLVTDRDLALRVVALGRDPRRVTVREVMTEHLKTVNEGASIESALSLMRSAAVRRLPVVDDDGRLVGILSLDDILGLLAEEFVSIRGLLDREAPAVAQVSWPRA